MSLDIKSIVGSAPFAVLCGAGVSAQAGMPTAYRLHDLVLEYAATPELREVLDLFRPEREGVPRLRFEGILDVFQRTVDPELTLLDPYRRGIAGLDPTSPLEVTPTSEHDALAAIAKQSPVVTTNIDGLIEAAASAKSSMGVPFPVAFREADFNTLPSHGLWKIHGTVVRFDGSTAEHVPTDDEGGPVVTLQRISRTRESGARERFLKQLMRDRVLVVVGYSGSDDFDVTRWLREELEAKRVVWIQFDKSSGDREVSLEDVLNPDRRDTYSLGLRKLASTRLARRTNDLVVLLSPKPLLHLWRLAELPPPIDVRAGQAQRFERTPASPWEQAIVTGSLLAQLSHYRRAIVVLGRAIVSASTTRERAISHLEIAQAYLGLGGSDANLRNAQEAASQTVELCRGLGPRDKSFEGRGRLVQLAAARRMALGGNAELDLETLEREYKSAAREASDPATAQSLMAVAFEARVERAQVKRWKLSGEDVRADSELVENGLLPPKGMMAHDKALNEWKAATTQAALTEAVKKLEQAREFREDMGDISGLCGSLNVLGFMAQRWAWLFPSEDFCTSAASAYRVARENETRCLELARRHGLVFHIGQGLVGLIILELREGNVCRARDLLDELLGIPDLDVRTAVEARFCAAMCRLADGASLAASATAAAHTFARVAIDARGIPGDARMAPMAEAASINRAACSAWSQEQPLGIPLVLRLRKPTLSGVGSEQTRLDAIASSKPSSPLDAAQLLLDCLGP